MLTQFKPCFLFFLLSIAGSSTAFSQITIDGYGLGKKADYLQNSASTPTSHEILGDPGGPFHFSADVTGSNLLSLSPSAKLTLPNSTKYDLAGTNTELGAAFNYTTKAALDGAFPNGAYTITGGTYALPLSLGGSDGFPSEVPQITNGVWDGQGRLVINASIAATVAFNNFSAYSSGLGALVSFDVYTLSGNVVGTELASSQSVALNGYSSDPILTGFTIPGGLLQPNQTYYAELSFGRILDLKTASFPAVGLTTFVRTTGFTISTAATGLPVITGQPASQTVIAGANVLLVAAASGNPAPTYQWRKDGVNISGATLPSYAFNNVQLSDAGSYTVVATNSAGSVTSNAAILTVNLGNAAPIVTVVSSVRTVLSSGQTFSLEVTPDSSGTPSYQWAHNGRPIAGATSATYKVSKAVPNDSGWYVVTVTNAYGATRSVPLFVIIAPASTRVRTWGGSLYGIDLTPPTNLSDAVSISAGNDHILAVRRNGTITGWGSNLYGRLNLPNGLSNVVAISAGWDHGLALTSNGMVVAWGNSLSGTEVPTNLINVVAVAAGYAHSLALKSDGTVVAWGGNHYGETDVPGNLNHVIAISAGFSHSLALRDDGSVVAWGRNDEGQSTIPADATSVAAVAGGGQHTLLLKTNGIVRATGRDHLGQIDVPPTLAGVVAIAAGDSHSLALRVDGTLVCWGGNILGESLAPTDLTRVLSISASTTLSVALCDTAAVAPPAVNAATADFDGDGQSDLIWQNTLTGERSFWLMNGTIFKRGVSLGMFAPDWTIVGSGDFNRDDQPDLLWQNTITGQRSIWLMNGTSLSIGVDLGTYSTDLRIVGSGDFNGDGETDIVWQNSITGESSIWLMSGTTKSSEVSLGVRPTAWSIAGTGDFNSDGKMDLVWQNAATGERSVWLMNGTTMSSEVSLGFVAKQFQIVGTGDYNGDGKTDLVGTDTETGDRSVWLMNGLVRTSTVVFTHVSVEWSLGRPIFLTAQTAHADFNADGQTDIVWQNSSTGARKLWLMNGTTKSSESSLPTVTTNWVVSGTGDFNHDDQPDIVWTNTATGERSVWLMDGATFISSVPLTTVPTAWEISAIGDFNYDGKPDLVWTNTVTGERAIWLMNGLVFGSGISLGTIPAAWKIATTADLNGDGKTDLVWQNTSTGESSVWLMNGGAFTAGVVLDTLPVQWAIVGSGDFNGDGKADLLLQNTATGERAVRLMNRTTFLSTISLGIVDTHWSINN